MVRNHHSRITGALGLALLVLLGPIFTASGLKAMDPSYLVAKVTGVAPQSAAVLHLPPRFMREGQELSLGEDYLFLPDSTVVLVDLDGGDFYTVNGPNRITVQKEGLVATDPGRMIRHKKAYFSDPASAVLQVSRLLLDENWLELALYYDLTGSGISPASLLSGAFFKHDHPPEVGHPGVLGGIKQPFSPSFSYLSNHTLENNEVRVTVQISIDQGMGMTQEGRDSFNMRKVGNGYRLLPKNMGSSESGEAPFTDPGPGPGPLK